MYWKFTDGVMPKSINITAYILNKYSAQILKNERNSRPIWYDFCVFKDNIHVDMLHSGKRALLILDEKINKLIRKHSNYELYKCYKNINTRLQV